MDWIVSWCLSGDDHSHILELPKATPVVEPFRPQTGTACTNVLKHLTDLVVRLETVSAVFGLEGK